MNFQAICRVCTGENPGMLSIFESYNFSADNCEIFKAITDCASVQIRKFDGFSQQICRKCLDHLSQAYSFKKLCEDSDYKFRNELILCDDIKIKNEFEIENYENMADNIEVSHFGFNEVITEQCDPIKTENNYDKDPNATEGEELNSTNPFSIFYESIEHQASSLNEDDKSDDSTSSQKSELSCKSSAEKNQPAPHITTLTEPAEMHVDDKFVGDFIASEKIEIKSEFYEEDTNINYVDRIDIKEGTDELSDVGLTPSENKYKCEICDRNFSVKSYLAKHMKLHKGEKQYKCHICDKSFSVKCNLMAHVELHTGEKQYKCQFCHKNFSVKSYLAKHLKFHTGEKQYKCHICDKNFTQKCYLVRHVNSHTGFKCDVCDKNFADKSYLAKHVKLHTGEEQYKCDVCDKNFSLKSNLTAHIKLHTGEKQYKCDICDKKFSLKRYLARHISSHTGFGCHVCGKTIARKSNLANHIKLHTGEKVIEDISVKRNLVRHKSSLAGFKCDICGKNFSSKSYFATHMKLHTGEKQYKCEVCDKNFSGKSYLTKHIKLHIRDNINDFVS